MGEALVRILAIVLCLAVGPWMVWQMFDALDTEMALSEQASLARR